MEMIKNIVLVLMWLAISVVIGVGGFLVIDSPAFSSAETVAVLALTVVSWMAVTLAFLMAIEG